VDHNFKWKILKKTFFLNFELKIFVFEFWKKLAIGNGQFWKKIDFEIWMEIWKIEICHEKLKWKNWNFSFLKFDFHFWNLKWKFLFKFFKKLAYHQMEMKKQMKWRNHIFHLCHRDKTFNNTLIPPLHITLYHMCRLWWYTINLSRRILSYWSFFQQWYRVVWSTVKKP
jgi:hypothetical protein